MTRNFGLTGSQIYRKPTSRFLRDLRTEVAAYMPLIFAALGIVAVSLWMLP